MGSELECNTCTGAKKVTPTKIENSSGMESISYRVGTYSQFKESMHVGISQELDLKDLTFRGEEDLALGLVDVWAIVSDVITFYQERIANEGFLRTATEKKSIVELARMVGYELSPGVAANTYLAFTLDESKNNEQKITIGKGTKVQSIPVQGELPQTFETVEQIDAMPEWNAARPVLTRKQLITNKTTKLVFKGTATLLKKGDLLLICDKPHNEKEYCKIGIMTVSEVQPKSTSQQTFVSASLVSSYNKKITSLQGGVYTLRIKSGLFGNNAPYWTEKIFPGTTSWNDATIKYFSEKIRKQNGYIYLDNVYPTILVNDLVVLKYGNYFFTFGVSEVDEISLAEFSVSSKVTELKLDLPSTESLNLDIRKITVYGQPEFLELSEIEITEPVDSNTIKMNSDTSGLKKGQLVVISGQPSNDEKSPEIISEVAKIYDIPDSHTIVLEKKSNSYKRDTVYLNFNVARATHGETKQEVLGSGDASSTMQTFVLKQKPLTYVSSPKRMGSESTLEVRIDDVLWHEADNLFDLGSKDRNYITRLDENGNTTVMFGDGKRGARPNTGTENIRVQYRVGSGIRGIVKENQLTMLMNRPLGVRGVTNPLPSEGAQDPQDSDVGRKKSPLNTLTMGRLVSIQDFEDYANEFSGVGKAKATWGWNGQHKTVCLTIMSTSGEEIPSDSQTFKSLSEAINNIKDPLVAFQLCGFGKTTFNLSTKILIDPDKEFDKIKLAVETMLFDEFSPNSRQFGQDVTLSEIMSLIQNIDGVLAVDVDFLYITGTQQKLQSTLLSQTAIWNGHSLSTAELLCINKNGIQILEMII